MRIQEIKLYKFDELTKETQEKVFEKYYDYNTQYFSDDLCLDWYKDKLDCMGFIDAKIQYSGFCSQGDGLSFESGIDINKIFSYFVYDIGKDIKYTDLFIFEKFINLMDKNMIEFSFWSKRISNQYLHENTCRVDYEIELYLENCSSKAEDYFYKSISDIRDMIEYIRHEICQDLYHMIESEYEYQQSEGALKETFINNEIEFTEDGIIY